MNKFLKLFILVCVWLSILAMAALDGELIAKEPSGFPILIESSIKEKPEGAVLSIRLANRSLNNITVPLDFLKNAFWQVWAIDEGTGDEFKLRQLLPRIYEREGGTALDRLNEMRLRLEETGEVISIKPGSSHEMDIPLNEALSAAKLLDDLAFRVVVQLGFDKILAKGEGLTNAQSLELFQSTFYSSLVVLDKGKWKLFGRANKKEKNAPKEGI